MLGLPRGGVPVAYEVARRLHLPLDVFVVRKLGMPGQEELAIGAIASGGIRVLDETLIARAGLDDEMIAEITSREEHELVRRDAAYRGGRPAPVLKDREVLLVDDGLATGATMRAAVLAVRAREPSKIWVAVPLGAAPTVRTLEEIADEVICPLTPWPFFAVGAWYEDFSPTTDDEVRALLEAAAAA